MLYLKPKQQQVMEAINNPDIHTIILIGSVGTGKTDIAAHAGISIAYQFPKTYFPVFRQNISTAKKSIIPSYLNVLDRMNFVEKEDYIHNKSDHTIFFPHSKSTIIFAEADITKDRDAKKLKGINASANHIDEADELNQLMFNTAVSRRGRMNESGQPSLSIITMNPNDTHLREKYYKPWKNPEKYGPLPKGVIVIEFTIEDSWQTKIDIDNMLSNPKPWVERYINNNWEYNDDDSSLFKYRYFAAAVTDSLNGSAPRFEGYDVARSGTDRSVMALWYGKTGSSVKTLVDIQIFKEKDEQIMTDDQALEVIKYTTQNAVLPEHVSIDAVGVGVGVVDHMKSKGMKVLEFVSGGKPTSEKYEDLRSQVIFEFSQGLEKGEIKIFEGCPFRNELISEAMSHIHTITGKKLKVESKEEIKKRTGGLSPDIFDAVIMGLYPQLSIDSKRNSKRIRF